MAADLKHHSRHTGSTMQGWTPTLRKPPRHPGAAAALRRPRWTRPVLQFVAAGLVALVLLIVASGWLSKRAATEEAIADARETTWLIAASIVEPALTPELVRQQPAALERFDDFIQDRVMVGDMLRVKLWDENGTIVYSDEPRLIGERFDLGADELAVLAETRSTDAEVSDLSQPENDYENDVGRLLEVYARVALPGGRPLLFEAYYSYDTVAGRSADVLQAFRPIPIAGLLVFMALTVPLVWVLARRLDVAAAERERLLVAAVEASDAERRRIARDLHDGVVQHLAGISFGASATARELEGSPELARRIEALGTGVRHSLRALRSLLVEIYPPDLRTEGLAAALDDLVAPATAAGIAVDLQVADTEGVRDEAIALTWRVAQEAVRNAVRHGNPTELHVRVTVTDHAVQLVVADNGVGFDPATVPREGHLGLRSLRDLVVDSGGTLVLDSVPGAGTTVRLEIAR